MVFKNAENSSGKYNSTIHTTTGIHTQTKSKYATNSVHKFLVCQYKILIYICIYIHKMNKQKIDSQLYKIQIY